MQGPVLPELLNSVGSLDTISLGDLQIHFLRLKYNERFTHGAHHLKIYAVKGF